MIKKLNESHFVISQATKAIKNIDISNYYKTIILEGDEEYYAFDSAEKILDYSCIMNDSSLEGRRIAVKNRYQIHSKIPIPVIPDQGVYMMPTSSTTRKDCVWISFFHIKFYAAYKNKTYVAFIDGTDMVVNASVKSFDMQHKRTSQIIISQNRSLFFDGKVIQPDNKINA